MTAWSPDLSLVMVMRREMFACSALLVASFFEGAGSAGSTNRQGHNGLDVEGALRRLGPRLVNASWCEAGRSWPRTNYVITVEDLASRRGLAVSCAEHQRFLRVRFTDGQQLIDLGVDSVPLDAGPAARLAPLSCYPLVRMGRLLAAEAVRAVALVLGQDPFAGPDRGDLYQFGIFYGASMLYYQYEFPEARHWAFDSFTGLPPEAPGTFNKDNWWPHKFHTRVSPRMLIKNLTRLLGGPRRAGFVRGYFDKTLTPELRIQRGMRPAALVDLDTDSYISTTQALSWLFTNGLIKVGTVIHYDDWAAWWCTSMEGKQKHPGFRQAGEPLAHIEASERFGARFACLAGVCREPKATRCDAHFIPNAVFVVTAIGAPPGEKARPHDGIDAGADAMNRWALRSPVCQQQIRARHLVQTGKGPAWSPTAR